MEAGCSYMEKPFSPKKFLQLSLMFMAFAISLQTTAYAAQDGPIAIVVGGLEIENDAAPFIEQNEIMVSINGVAEAMGLRVSDLSAGDVYVYDDIHKSYLMLLFRGSDVSMVFRTESSQRSIEYGVLPMKIDSRLFVPLHSLADAFDYAVQWDENTNTATLTNNLDTPFFAGKKANVAHSLLDDRLTIFMPEGSELQSAFYGGLMDGVEVGGEYEANLILSGYGQTLSVNVSELHLYSTGDIKNDASLFIESINKGRSDSGAFTIPEPIKADGASFIVMQPVKNDSNIDFIMGALVRAADNTLLFARVYADQKAMTYPEDCTNLARQIVNSIQGGTRSLNADGQTLRLGDYSITLSRGYVPTLKRGADFDVWYFTKLVTIGDVQSSFGIYRGNHPSSGDNKTTNNVTDIVLNRMITWHLYTESPGVFDENSYAETIIRTGISGWDAYMHIFASPMSEADWKDIRTIVRSLRDTNGATTYITLIIFGLVLVIIIFVILLIVRRRKKVNLEKKNA